MAEAAAKPLRGYVLGGAAFLLAPVALYASAQITPLFLVAAAAVLLLSLLRGRPLSPPAYARVAGVLAIALLWGAASVFWSIDAEATLERALRLLGLFLAGFVLLAVVHDLEEREAALLEWGVLAGVVAGVLLLALEIVTDLALFRAARMLLGGEAPAELKVFNRGATVLALLLWPALAILWKRNFRLPALLLAAVILAILLWLDSFSAILATGLAAPLFLATVFRPALGTAGAAALIILAVLATPFLAYTLLEPANLRAEFPSLPASTRHRAYIWKFAADRIAERPWFGWGLDASRSVPGGRELFELELPPEPPRTGFAGRAEPLPVPVEKLPLHPHNAVLQVWLELGAVGAGLVLAFVLLAIARIRRLAGGRWRAGTAVGFLVAAFSIAFASYGIWQSWWLAALWLGGAFTAAAVARAGREGG